MSRRRRYPRYPVRRIVSYDYNCRQYLTLTVDLGLGGMKIKAHFYLPENERLNFKLVLETESIWVKGRIVYSRLLSDNQGVSEAEFVELSTQDQISLENFLVTPKGWPKPQGMIASNERAGGIDYGKAGDK